MQTLKIRRPKENFNENIDYKILIDGIKVASLKNGEEKLISINENSKSIVAKINSGSSENLRIDKISENKIIQVYGNEFMNKYLKYFGLIFPVLGLTFILDHDYELIKLIGKVLFGLAILLVIYILIFMKEKWLILKS